MPLEQHVTLSLITVNVSNSSPTLPGLQHETNSLSASFFTEYSERWAFKSTAHFY
jgi:hypothetical protein